MTIPHKQSVISRFYDATKAAERILRASEIEYLANDPVRGRHEYAVRGESDVVIFDIYQSGPQIVCEVDGTVRARSRNGGYVGTVGAQAAVRAAGGAP